ncbi:MAG: sugar phosphate isomerase/epimerase [Ruminococcaceae bacterium]|nr:sugar phosphate isomerase/epimerase [Oscillospiraceae bacterium]
MRYSSTTDYLAKKYGLEEAVKMLIEAGYTAMDFSMFNTKEAPFTDDYKEVAERILKIANENGVVFNQAHAPFTSNTEIYENELVPLLPRAFEFASLLGIKNIVVHPRQNGRYYGREEELFEKNIEFYTALKPFAKKYGVKIAIENMWQRHPIAKYICDDVCAPPEELARLYDTLNDPEVFTICLDLGHVALCGREPHDAIKCIGNRIGCLHVHDVDYVGDLHTLPGVAKINWDKVCQALADINYEGDITLEADNFFVGFLPEMHKTAAKFMADTARSLVEKIEFYKSLK